MTLEVPVWDPQRSFYFKSCDVDVKVTAFLPVALRLVSAEEVFVESREGDSSSLICKAGLLGW